MLCATEMFTSSDQKLSWLVTKKIVDKVQSHIYGHSAYADIKVLLERNDIWYESISEYLINPIALQLILSSVSPTESNPKSFIELNFAPILQLCVLGSFFIRPILHLSCYGFHHSFRSNP